MGRPKKEKTEDQKKTEFVKKTADERIQAAYEKWVKLVQKQAKQECKSADPTVQSENKKAVLERIDAVAQEVKKIRKLIKKI